MALFIISGIYAINIDNCTYLGTADTEYTLTAHVLNLSGTCFRIAANNVTLDCAGFSIVGGNASSSYGIWAYKSNATIKNCNVSNFYRTLYFDNSDQSILINSNISTTYTTGYAFYVVNSDFGNISNNTFSSNVIAAVRVAGSTYNNWYNNTFISTADKSAVQLQFSTSLGNTIFSNNFTQTSGYYVYDADGGNYLNSTEGNIYYNSDTFNPVIWGSNPSSIPNYYIGTYGAVPYNDTTSNGKVNVNLVDYLPLTRLTTPYPSDFYVFEPDYWQNRYYLANSTLTINWSNSTSQTGQLVNYTVILFRYYNNTDNASAAQLGVNVTDNNFTTNTTNRHDFYFIAVTACDNLTGYCITNYSDIFLVSGVPTVWVDYSSWASPSLINVPNVTFKEYCQYHFYPNKTEYIAGANLTHVGGEFEQSKTSAISCAWPETCNNEDTIQFTFNDLEPDNYIRQCYAINIYNTSEVSEPYYVDIMGLTAEEALEQQQKPDADLGLILLSAGLFLYVGFITYRLSNWVFA